MNLSLQITYGNINNGHREKKDVYFVNLESGLQIYKFVTVDKVK